MKTMKIAAALLSSASTLALTSFASAQTAPDAGPKAVEEVVVTGSRVIRNGDSSPTPVTVVGVDDALRQKPGTIADALNELPVFSGSRGQLSNPSAGTANAVGGGSSAGNNLNLRNMGSVRTLILFDGLRVPPTNVSGNVDVDMIPQMLLQRVDVVTGGVSAVYGSDAISGVVNFITDRNFNGLKANAQYGVSQLGDGVSYNAGIAAGKSLFDGRGHVEVSYEYRDDRGIPSRHSRDFLRNVWTVQGQGTAAAPYTLVANARVTTSAFGGLINLGALNGQVFNPNGSLHPFIHGAATGTGTGIEIGGDGVYQDVSLRSSLESHQLFGRFDFDFTDTIHGYAAVAYNNKLNGSYTGAFDLNNVSLSSTNAYLLPTYQAQLAAAKQTTFRMSKRLIVGPREHPISGSEQVFANLGLNGELGDYKWNIGYVHSTAELTVTNNNNINLGRRAAALDAVVNPANGQIVCNVTLTNPTLYPGCVPLNLFGVGSENPAALDYIQGTSTFVAHTKLDDISGAVTGSPVATWAGPVNVALSAEYRRTAYHAEASSHPTDLLNCTGLRFNCVQGTTAQYQSTNQDRPEVEQKVTEGAVEVDVPLLKDVTFFKNVNVNGAARYTHYDLSGNYWTWKLGLDWAINDDLRVRATRSRDIRAPTLDDLYAPATTNTNATFQDLFTGQTVTGITSVNGGNPNLTAEIGDTKTAGIVYKPGFVPGLSVAVDVFDITVSNAILSLLATNSTFQKACFDSKGTSPYCSLYTRPSYANNSPANNVTVVRNTVVNIAEQHSNGVDVEVNYATRLLDRPASLRFLTTYQPHLELVQPGLPTLDNAGVAYGTNAQQAAPIWRVTGMVRFSPIDNLDVSVQTRWRDSLTHSADPTHVIASPNVPAVAFTSLNVSYGIESAYGKSELFLNVSNLFDKDPPPSAFYGSQTNPGGLQGFALGDDPVGRAFTFGVRFRH